MVLALLVELNVFQVEHCDCDSPLGKKAVRWNQICAREQRKMCIRDRATTTSWSPILKKMIALACVETEHSKLGTQLQMEITIEAIRLKTNVKVTGLPFFSPPRKTATPV